MTATLMAGTVASLAAVVVFLVGLTSSHSVRRTRFCARAAFAVVALIIGAVLIDTLPVLMVLHSGLERLNAADQLTVKYAALHAILVPLRDGVGFAIAPLCAGIVLGGVARIR